MEWWTLPVLAVTVFLVAVAIEKFIASQNSNRVKKFEIERERQISVVRNLTHVQMTAWGAFVTRYDPDTDRAVCEWHIPGPEPMHESPNGNGNGNGQPTTTAMRRDALRLLNASDELYPSDATRLASQDDMQTRGMSPTRHSEIVKWLSGMYGVLPTNKGTFCGHPFIDRPALWNAVITMAGEKPTPPPRAAVKP
jgi:hypothetical protein